ncbi:MAG: sigma-70 family RNA polymerase sigma factor [Phycisphaerales bacterium JB063]
MPNTPDSNSFDMGHFARAWSTSQDLIRLYVDSVIWNPHDAEDVIQKVAYQAGKNYEQYDPERPFSGWVLGIAKNEVRMHLRSRARDRHVFGEGVLDMLASTAAEQSESLPPRTAALRDCVKQMPESGKALLRMRYTENLKGPELANRLGMSHNAVLLRLRRLRGALGKCINARMAGREGTS